MSEAQKRKQDLIEALSPLKESLRKSGACILLDHPNHGNIGDSLIWLGEVLYLREFLGVKILYESNTGTHSDKCISAIPADVPILLHGGGNLGDLWLNHQLFREHIIKNNPDREIFILPQSIYFQSQDSLKQSRHVFNTHPNLTVFCRDIISLRFARENYQNCRSILSPDCAFYLADEAERIANDVSVSSVAAHGESSSIPDILFLNRGDKEADKTFSYTHLSGRVTNLTVSDWLTLSEIKLHATKIKTLADRLLPYFHNTCTQSYIDSCHTPKYSYLAANLLYLGAWQFLQHSHIITNRLHGHILATLLGIPHLFLANSYHKNRAFYSAWSQSSELCVFLEEKQHLEACISSLLLKDTKYPKWKEQTPMAAGATDSLRASQEQALSKPLDSKVYLDIARHYLLKDKERNISQVKRALLLSLQYDPKNLEIYKFLCTMC